MWSARQAPGEEPSRLPILRVCARVPVKVLRCSLLCPHPALGILLPGSVLRKSSHPHKWFSKGYLQLFQVMQLVNYVFKDALILENAKT